MFYSFNFLNIGKVTTDNRHTMKLIKSALCIIALVTIQICADAQAIRATYKFFRKTQVTDSLYRIEPDMMLDYDGKTAAFYSDATYYRDSLSILALDNNGNIQNHDAYEQIFNYRAGATNDAVLIDFANNSFEVKYHEATVYIIGKGAKLEMPQWELHDTTVTSSLGYEVKMATAQFMGRQWKVWYTEEIPVPAGPWMLWGAPGLITYAEDSQRNFAFKLLNIYMLDSATRYDNIKKYYYSHKGRKSFYIFDIKKAEKVHNKAVSDENYLFELAGERAYSSYSISKDGKKEISRIERPYIPLIAEDYWK